MKSDILRKMLAAASAIAVLLTGGFVLVVITTFSGGQKFYTPMVVVVTAVLIIFVLLLTYEFVQRKLLKRLFIVFVGCCFVAVAVYEINQSYHDSYATVASEANIYEYVPFAENSKAVSLDVSANLTITGDLPRLDGATALYPLYAAFVQATYPEGEYNPYRSEVMCTKTGEAYNRLINGETDVIFAARPSKAHLEQADSLGIELKLTPIGREAFVFFVNARNDVGSLTTEQIQGIYSGDITNWQELGGSNDLIRAFQRPENSGSQTMLQNLMEGKVLMTPPKEDVVAGMGGIIEQTANYRNYKDAIGYSFLYFATEMIQNGEIKLLEIDGVYPDRNTIRSGEYPLASEFYAVTAGNDNPNIELFIEWIVSEQGQEIVERTGYTPIAN